MCRIWGVVYGPKGPDAEPLTPGQMARILFPALIKKGPHAWGWAQWRGKGHKVEVRKYPGLVTNQTSRIRIARDAKWVLGHTRLATHGSPKDNRNNHPLQHGNIIGLHNGVLRNHDEILDLTGRFVPGTEVDSEAIFAAVNLWGLEYGLKRIEGDMVTVFVDKRNPQIVNIARSVGRPLYMAWTDAGSLVFASEEQALDRLVKAGMILSEYTRALGDHRLLRVMDGEIFERITYKRAPKPRKPKAKSRKPARLDKWEVERNLTKAQRRGRIFASAGTKEGKRRAAAEVQAARDFIERERARIEQRSSNRA